VADVFQSGWFAVKPRLLDLFAGAGGAARGYMDAGFYVVGVDVRPMPRYCGDEFVQADALNPAEYVGWGPFDAIHASPPCQKFTAFAPLWENRKEYVDLLTPTRSLLEQTGLPWVIENVPGAPMRADAVLCGSMFNLGVRRHRWFEFSWGEPLMTLSCDHSRETVCVVGHGGGSGKGTKVKRWRKAEGARAMGIDWMNRNELSEAIPPAYTRLVGEQLVAHLQRQAA
jgi:hypothetical protein